MTESLPTVREVLRLPELTRAEPEVVAGESGIDDEVRWVHISEIPDVSRYLRGGELVLATGTGLPGDEVGLCDYLRALAEVNAAGVVIGLRRDFEKLPPSATTLADERSMPVVLLGSPVPFVNVTEVVHAWILSARRDELRTLQDAGDSLMALGMQGSSPTSLVAEVSRVMGCTVVLEDMAHRVIASAGSDDEADVVLGNWEFESRRVSCETGSTYDERYGWLVSVVSMRDQSWGRLVAILPRASEDERRTLEHGAAAIAVSCLIDHQQSPLFDGGQQSLVQELADGSYSSAAALHRRAEALGARLRDRCLTAAIVRARSSSAPWISHRDLALRERELVIRVRKAARDVTTEDVAVIHGRLQPLEVGVVLSHSAPDRRESLLEAFSEAVHRLLATTTVGVVSVGVSAALSDVRDLRAAFLHARQASEGGWNTGRRYNEQRDAHVRGLLSLLRDDPRLVEFLERELGPLLAHEQGAEELLRTLRTYVEVGGNKSAMASTLSISRPTLYQRLERIQKVLRADLEDSEVRTSLHLAILALDQRAESVQSEPALRG